MGQVTREELMAMSIKIDSANNFRTSAGLASSSSGLSCLAVCLATLYGVTEEFEG